MRTRLSIHCRLILLCSTLSLFSCEGELWNTTTTATAAPTPTPAARTGVFIDSPTGGINYSTVTVNGSTNTNGEFQYNDGESVTFSIGSIDFPTVAARPVITLLDVVNTQDVNNISVVNIARLLQSLDIDGDPINGIMISSTAHLFATGLSVDFSSPTFDTNVANLVANSGSVTTTLIGKEAATSHLQDTLLALGLMTPAPAEPASTPSSTVTSVNNTTESSGAINTGGAAILADGLTITSNPPVLISRETNMGAFKGGATGTFLDAGTELAIPESTQRSGGGGFNIPTGTAPSPLWGATAFTTQMLRFEEFGPTGFAFYLYR